MCGHVGILAKSLTEPQKKAFYDMLYLDVLRGEDSTGVAAISNAFTNKPEVEIFKSIGSATDFFDEHSIGNRSRAFTYKPVSFMLGHNRAATQGAVTAENAHPFDFENLVGAHNGTVLQSSLSGFEGYREFDIDSQIIFSHLSHTQDVEEVWKEADGAMALVWWDKVAQKVNIVRNSQRPMHYALSKDGKMMIYSSELWMLMVAAMRHNIKLQEAVEVKPNRLYTFDIDEEDKVVCEERDIPPFVEKPKPLAYGHYGNYKNDWRAAWDDVTTPHTVKTENQYENIVIREFNDSSTLPTAVAFTKEGSLVKVNIPVVSYEAAKKALISRGTGKGYYVADRLYKSGLHPDQFWCNWEGLTYVSLKGSAHILRKEADGFEIVYPTETNLAPWFTEHVKLNQPGFKAKTRDGCLNCYNVPTWEDRHDLHWLGREDFVCKTCQNLPFVKEMISEHKVA